MHCKGLDYHTYTNLAGTNELYLNPTPFESKSREDSGRHKGRTLFHLETLGYRFGIHYEDDPVQAEVIKKMMPHINVVLLQHDLVEKENKRHEWNKSTDIETDAGSVQLSLF